MSAILVLLTMLSLQVAVPSGDDPMQELAARITREMEAVNRALREAADAEAVTDQLDTARDAHLRTIRDIEAMIRQVKYTRSQSSQSGSDGSPSQTSGEPQQPKPRESDGSQSPEPQEEPGERPQPRREGQAEQPDDNAQPDGSGGREEQGRTPPRPDKLEPFTAQDTDSRWGLLPPKLQERLMNLQVDDVPERYRAWMEAYIRALNSREQAVGGRGGDGR